MSLREKLNRYPGIIGAVVVIAIAVMLWQTLKGSGAPNLPSKGFYTVDDGKTWFVDSLYRAAPFDHEGKQAFGAVVMRCGAEGKPFVAYMTRLNGPTHKEVSELEAKKDSNFPLQFMNLQRQGTEIKKPGDKNWYDPGTGGGQRVYAEATTCPGGGAQPDMVNP